MIRILAAGPHTSIQDRGRTGFRQLGISESGALDSQALAYGNVLVGNPQNSAVLEIMAGPVEVAFDCNRWIVITGAAMQATISSGDNSGEKPLTMGWRLQAQPGDVLRIAGSGVSYLAIEGGIDVPALFKSRSTDIGASMGGWHGRLLKKGDVLSAGKQKSLHKSMGVRQTPSDGIVRAIPCPDYLQFDPGSQAALWNTAWRVTPQSNRMGCRLDGGNKLVYSGEQSTRPSQGVFPGVIQVPPGGNPIVLLADAQTTGGYPVIATVIKADLWKLAQTAAGQSLQFRESNAEEAVAALREEKQRLRQFQSVLKKHGKH